MAASLRGGANNNGGKEKRGTSPSSILKKTSKASSSSSSSVNEEKMSSPTETGSKPVPNYLKPTMSSSLDFSRIHKKSSGPEKPALNRRRSFDRPPPSAQVQRAVRGPSGSGGRDMKPQRSTSFNVRPASEKLFARTSSLKDKKLEEPKLLKSKSVKKSTLSSSSSSSPNKEQASAKKAPRSVTSESSLDYDNNENNNNNDSQLVDCLIREEDDLVNLDEHEVQSLPEMSEMPDVTQELADPNPTNFEVGGLVKPLDEQDKSAVSDELVPLNEEDSAEVHNQEEPADDDVQLKAEDDQLKGEDAGEQKLVVESTEDQKDEEGEKTVSEVGTTTEATVEQKKEEEEEETKATEAEKKEEIITTEEKESAVSSPSGGEAEKTQSSGGQKDKQAYNDVIEETATKLRGKKNKVLALAGAFETVISLDKS